jgi:hypothetical protein
MEEWMWLISLIGSLGAVSAALAAWWSAKETQKTVLAQILMQITDAYSSPEMLSGMLNLRKWQQQYGSDFAKKFGEMRRSDYSKIEQIDKDRRRYSHHFHKIRLLLDSGVVSKSFVKKIVSPGQVDFLLGVIEPLEEALNPNSDHSTFDTFRRIYQKDGICDRKN